MLAGIDQRLRGLVVSLEVFRVIDGGGALVGVGVVGPYRATSGGTTTVDLWKLARQALEHHGVNYVRPGGCGDDTFLADYGRTVQVAWLTGGSLVTASVTGPDSERDWILRAARVLAAHRQKIRRWGLPCSR
jgi:hypothetical protein